MTTAQKNNIAEWVKGIEDDELLQNLELVRKSYQKGDWFNDLSQSEKDSIQRGLNDHKNNQTLSSKEFWSQNE